MEVCDAGCEPVFLESGQDSDAAPKQTWGEQGVVPLCALTALPDGVAHRESKQA